MHLVRELDDGVGPVVEEAFEPVELALGVVADPVRDLDVLALDDGPHAAPPGCRGRWSEYSRAGPDGPVSARGRPSTADDPEGAGAIESAAAHGRERRARS